MSTWRLGRHPTVLCLLVFSCYETVVLPNINWTYCTLESHPWGSKHVRNSSLDVKQQQQYRYINTYLYSMRNNEGEMRDGPCAE